MESEKKEWKQENEKLNKKVEHLEDEAIIKNAKLLELGNLFLIPQLETKSIYSTLIICRLVAIQYYPFYLSNNIYYYFR